MKSGNVNHAATMLEGEETWPTTNNQTTDDHNRGLSTVSPTAYQNSINALIFNRYTSEVLLGCMKKMRASPLSKHCFI